MFEGLLEPSTATGQPRALLMGIVFGLSLAVFLISPAFQVLDSHYSMLVSQVLLEQRSFDLSSHFAPDLESNQFPSLLPSGLPFHVRRSGNAVFYYFPPGTSILSTPLVAVLNLFGISAIGSDGMYDPSGEIVIERIGAALLMAFFVLVVLRTAGLILPPAWSVGIALAVALGTQVWSTTSRGLWSHSWQIVLLALVAYRLLASETGRKQLNPARLATLLAWAYFTRPTTSVAIIAVGLYLLFRQLRALPVFAAVLSLWMGLFIVYSWLQYGEILPPYFMPKRLYGGTFFSALAANLVSPSRGLLLYVPQLFFVFYLLLRYRDAVRRRSLIALALLASALHLAVIASFPKWWGGHCYGPRLMTDALPWLVLLAILGVRAWLDSAWKEARAPLRKGVWPRGLVRECAVGMTLVILSVATNAPGALTSSALIWNVVPHSVDDDPTRTWDWSDPQFLFWWWSRD